MADRTNTASINVAQGGYTPAPPPALHGLRFGVAHIFEAMLCFGILLTIGRVFHWIVALAIGLPALVLLALYKPTRVGTRREDFSLAVVFAVANWSIYFAFFGGVAL